MGVSLGFFPIEGFRSTHLRGLDFEHFVHGFIFTYMEHYFQHVEHYISIHGLKMVLHSL